MTTVLGAASFAIAIVLFVWASSVMGRPVPPAWTRNWLPGDLLAIAVTAFLAFGMGGLGKGLSDLMGGGLGTVGLATFGLAAVLAVGALWVMIGGAPARAEPPLAPVTSLASKRHAPRHQQPKRRAA